MATVASSRGVAIGYEQFGNGQPVVLIPATGTDHKIFEPGGQIASLTDCFSVIAIDNRGTGESSRGTGAYSCADMADDVLAVMDALDVPRAHVLGLSLGSIVAQQVAIRAPDRVSALVLIGTWGKTDEYLRRLIDGWVLVYSAGAPAEYGWYTMAQLFSREFVNAQSEMIEAIVQMAFVAPQSPSREDCLQHLRVNQEHDAVAELPRIGVPTLVLTGEDDRTVPAQFAGEVASAIPDAKLEVLTGPGSGHGMFLERGEEVNRLVIDFLSGLAT